VKISLEKLEVSLNKKKLAYRESAPSSNNAGSLIGNIRASVSKDSGLDGVAEDERRVDLEDGDVVGPVGGVDVAGVVLALDDGVNLTSRLPVVGTRTNLVAC